MKRLIACLILTLSLVAIVQPALAATQIQEVTSPGGITAWLIEDHKLPLLALHFAFRGGVEQDPVDKQGLATFTMGLLTEGAGPNDATAFQQALADHSITLNFGAGRDALFGSLKALTSDRETALDLLQAALTQPRFDGDAIERQRAQQFAALRYKLGDPGWQGRYAMFQTLFGTHPYGQRSLGSTETLAAISQQDIKAFATDHMARDNLIIAVAGDITAAELGTALDHAFGGLPAKAKLTAIDDFKLPAKPAMILLQRQGTQTEMMFVMNGPKREDADWYADTIANYILGGGGFQSRLMHDVRDEKGLTYGIDTDLSPMEHGGLIVGDAAVANPKTGEAWQVAHATMQNFYDKGVTEVEVQSAKDYLTGELPLAMTSTDKIAGLLVGLQMDRLGVDHLDQRNDIIRAVTVDQVNAAIRRWFDPANLSLCMVGKPAGPEPTVTRELVHN